MIGVAVRMVVGAVPSMVWVRVPVSWAGALLKSTWRIRTDLRAGGQPLHRLDRIGDEAGDSRRQQALGGALQHLAGAGIDGLEEPRGRVGVQVHARTDAQDEAGSPSEVEIALERAPAARNLHRQAADLQATEAEAARIEVRVELGHDADLLDGVLAAAEFWNWTV